MAYRTVYATGLTGFYLFLPNSIDLLKTAALIRLLSSLIMTKREIVPISSKRRTNDQRQEAAIKRDIIDEDGVRTVTEI